MFLLFRIPINLVMCSNDQQLKLI